MKRSQLKEIVVEAMKGYSPQTGETKGGTTDDFRNILTKIAKGRPEEDSKEQPQDLQEDADRARAKDLGTLRGALMHIQTLTKAERPYSEISSYVEKMLQQTKGTDPLSEGAEQDYKVIFYVNDTDYDWDVKATSPEDAIAKVKSGKVKGPYDQALPRTARNFTAKLKK